MRPGTPEFRKERLRAAREARGISGAALAELSGVTRSAISQYERGEQTPSPSVLQAIANALNLPPRYFCTSQHNVESAVFYRSFASAHKKSRLRAERRLEWLCEIIGSLSEVMEFPKVGIDPGVQNSDLDLDDDGIDELATKIRRKWGLGDGPISDLVRLAENQGIVISRQFLDSKKIDAFSYWHNSSGNPLVVLSTDKNCAVRSRFDLAHEIGHLVLHRNVTSDDLKNPKTFKRMEEQANRFAGALLLPAKTFLRELYSLSLDALLALKPRWKTSVALMVKRCDDLGVLNEDLSQRLWINLGRRGWRKQEPLDGEIPIEAPQFLLRCFKLLSSSGATKDAVLSQLPYSPSEIESITGLPEGAIVEPEDKSSVMPKIIKFPRVS